MRQFCEPSDIKMDKFCEKDRSLAQQFIGNPIVKQLALPNSQGVIDPKVIPVSISHLCKMSDALRRSSASLFLPFYLQGIIHRTNQFTESEPIDTMCSISRLVSSTPSRHKRLEVIESLNWLTLWSMKKYESYCLSEHQSGIVT